MGDLDTGERRKLAEQGLKRHHGERVFTRESKHHAISQPWIERWRDRWDLLGLF